MTKKKIVVGVLLLMGIVMVSCNKTRRSPGRAYMPDMYYSRAYETFASTEGLKASGANYTGMPVPGTVARGDMFAYTLPNNDSGYARSASIRNPLDSVGFDMKESERLYLVYCAICHGAKLDGNGPLYKGGSGPYISKPASLVGDAKIEALSEGTMFHVVTHGKNAMGPYASQLSTQQRWMVVSYIKSKQKAKTGGTTVAADSTAAKDTTVTAPIN